MEGQKLISLRYASPSALMKGYPETLYETLIENDLGLDLD